MADRVEARQIIEASGESLRLQLYVVISSANSLAAVKDYLVDHLAYVQQLEQRHVLFTTGPLWTNVGAYFEGNGLLIFRASSVEEARAIADADPLHSSGARTYRLRPWLLNDGSIGVRVSLSKQCCELM